MAKKPRRQKWKTYKHRYRCGNKHQRSGRKGRKDQTQCNDGSQVVDKASCEDCFPELRGVETEFEHDRIHYRHRGCGQRHAREPTRARRPAQDVVSDGGAAKKWTEESNQAHHAGLFPLHSKNDRIEFSTRQECEDYCSCSRKKRNPASLGSETTLN